MFYNDYQDQSTQPKRFITRVHPELAYMAGALFGVTIAGIAFVNPETPIPAIIAACICAGVGVALGKAAKVEELKDK